VQSLKLRGSVFGASARVRATAEPITPRSESGDLHRHATRGVAGCAEIREAPLRDRQPFSMGRLKLIGVRRYRPKLMPLARFIPRDTDKSAHGLSLIAQ
jgi:hypothetical protein